MTVMPMPHVQMNLDRTTVHVTSGLLEMDTTVKVCTYLLLIVCLQICSMHVERLIRRTCCVLFL